MHEIEDEKHQEQDPEYTFDQPSRAVKFLPEFPHHARPARHQGYDYLNAYPILPAMIPSDDQQPVNRPEN
jgi:hypothetical protein